MINMLPGDGVEVSEVALVHPDFAGIHFTGSTKTFQHLWQRVGANIGRYRTYPRLGGRPAAKTSWWHTPARIQMCCVRHYSEEPFDYSGKNAQPPLARMSLAVSGIG